MLLFIFTGPVPGYEQIWLLGDEFLTRAAGHFFDGSDDHTCFMKREFDVKWFAGNTLHNNHSTLARICNQLCEAVEKHQLFPKLVIIIPDTDILQSIKVTGYGISEALRHLVHWMATEFNKIVEIHKDRLTNKSKKKNYPSFMWIPPPLHANFEDNTLRNKFAKSIKSSLHIQPHHMMLKLLKVWNYEDTSLAKANRYTLPSYKAFWKSLDSATEFWMKNLAPRNASAESTLEQQQGTNEPRRFNRPVHHAGFHRFHTQRNE